jgi:transposase
MTSAARAGSTSSVPTSSRRADIGAAVIRYAKNHGTGRRPWLTALPARRPTKVAAIALANKMARMAWAMMAKGERYKEPAGACGVNEIAPVSCVM